MIATATRPPMRLHAMERRLGEILTAALLRERPESLDELAIAELSDIDLIDRWAHSITQFAIRLPDGGTGRALDRATAAGRSSADLIHVVELSIRVCERARTAAWEILLRGLINCPAARQALYRFLRGHWRDAHRAVRP